MKFISILLVFSPLFAIDPKFFKKIKDGKKTVTIDSVKEIITVKKIFVSLTIGEFTYRKKRVLGKRENGNYR